MTQLVFRPYSWEDASRDNDTILPLRVWGKDRQGRAICLRVEDFTYHYWVELPQEVNGNYIRWNQENAEDLITNLAHRFDNTGRSNQRRIFSEDSLLAVQFPENGMQTLYYYKINPQIPMVCLHFRSKQEGNNFASRLRYEQEIPGYGKAMLKVHENINKFSSPLKLRTVLRITPCQWLQVTAEQVPEQMKVTTVNEYIARWQNISGIDPATTADWETHLRMMAVDGEMYSDNPKALPDRFLDAHCCFMWSCVVKDYKKDERETRRYCIVMGESHLIPQSELENSEIIFVKDEAELFYKYAELCQREDPDLIVGFNIYGFDNPYLNHRMERVQATLPPLGRVKNQESVYIEQQWESRAYNEMPINLFSMPGRMMLDLLTYFKRGAQKFSRYNLDTISRFFLGESKKDMSAKEMFRIYGEQLKLRKEKWSDPEKRNQNLTDMKNIALYCIQDSELLLKLIDRNNILTEIMELANVVHLDPLDTVIKGQTPRCMAQIFFMCWSLGIVIDIRETDSTTTFNGGAVAVPIVGLEDLVICWDFASMYPSIMRALNVDYTTLIRKEDVRFLDPNDYFKIEFTEEKDNAVSEEEINRAEVGLEYDVDEDSEEETVKKSGTEYFCYYWYRKKEGVLPALVKKLVYERNEVRAKMKTFSKQLDQSKELDKQLLELNNLGDNLTQQQRELRDSLLATSKERAEQAFRLKVRLCVMESQQLGLKVAGNSMYGFIGAKFGLPLPEGSRTVTAMGRRLIGQITEYVEKYYGGLRIYGDTDSTMMKIPGVTDAKTAIWWGEKIAEEVNKGIPPGGKDALGNVLPEGRPALLQAPMSIECEKVMLILCFKKKKYAYKQYKSDGSFVPEEIKDENGVVIKIQDKLNTKGVVMSRRDNCEFLRETYSELLRSIMDNQSLPDVYGKMFIAMQNLLEGKIPYESLVIVKSCRTTYAKESNPMKIFMDELKKDGKEVKGGDRLEYVVVKDPRFPKHDHVGYKKRSIEQYLERQNTAHEEVIDYSWYLAKHLRNPINQLLAVGFRKEIDVFKQQQSHFIADRKQYHLDEVMDILTFITLKSYSLALFVQWFQHVYQVAATYAALPISEAVAPIC